MSIFSEAARIAKDAVGETLCAAGGLQRAGLDAVEKATGGIVNYGPNSIPRAVQRGLDSFCPVPAGPVPLPVGGVIGGQCAAPYRAEISYSTITSPNTDFRIGFFDGTGPIERWSIFARPDLGPDIGQAAVVFASGAVFIGPSASFDPAQITRSELLVTRRDGQPDNCGDRPPGYPPPAPPPTNPIRPPITINIDLPDVGPVDVTFSPVVGPITIGSNNKVFAPVAVGIVGVNADVDFNIDLDFEIDLGDPAAPPVPVPPPPRDPDGRPRPPDCPPPPPCVPSPDEDDPDEEPPDNDDKKKVVVGAIVQSSVTVGARGITEIFQGRLPNLFVPRIAILRFRYKRPDGSIIFGPDISIKEKLVIVPAQKNGLVCVGASVFPSGGIESKLSLITAPSCPC